MAGSDEIVSTHNHPFWVVEGNELDQRPLAEHVPLSEQDNAGCGRWVDASALRVGDLLLGEYGRVQIDSISRYSANVKVYNLEVHGLHNYAVGTSGILVHNRADVYKPPLIPAPPTREAKDVLRAEARDIWQATTGRRASWDKLDVHHRIPLEWSHLFPKSDPNRLSNLIGVDRPTHDKVSGMWTSFRYSLKGRIPTSSEVMSQAIRFDEMFENSWNFPK